MALSGSLPQINLGVQGVTQGDNHIQVTDADCCAIGPEFESRLRHGCWCTGMSGGRPPTLSHGVLPQNLGGTEPNRSATCMVLKATTNDRRISSSLS
ncbi:hypothetical protein TNCV_522441 [Trichonephila clavipes]|nr:hypothetical protein TNCV_522441 [Trichonephila clavipes]